MDDDKQWLMYWFIYGVFILIESLLGFIICHIPFYFLIKIFFIIWLQNPLTRGAEKVYELYFSSFLDRHGEEIVKFSNALEEVLSGAGTAVSTAGKRMSGQAADAKEKDD